ncbi:MAG TPA: hypothetical protein VF266_04800 [Thermoanaerobaculia bacterium]
MREEDEAVHVPTPEEAAEIDAGFAEIARGECFDWDEVREALRRHQ